jgi:hypothetical protein
MESFSHLKLYCPERFAGGAGRSGGAVRILRRWIPAVFPWSPLVGMTGAVLSGQGAVLARGRVSGGLFQIDGAAQFTADEMTTPMLRTASRGSEPVCVCVPRSRILVRHFRIPGDSAGEIDSMLSHLLASELPRALDHYCWVWDELPTRQQGYTMVAVYIARNDRLEELRRPLLLAGFNVVGFVPEGWAWAHASRQVHHQPEDGADSPARSIIIRGQEKHYLVVERDGRLLFDMLLPATVLPGEGAAAAFGSSGPMVDDRGLVEARLKFQEVLEFSLPRPEVWPDNLPATGNENGNGFFFAASVAASGLERDRLMASPDMNDRTSRRTWLDTLGRVGRLAALAAVLWLVFALIQDRQMRGYLGGLEEQIAQEQEQVTVLEREFQAIRESFRSRVGNTEILQVVTSLRRQVRSPIYIEHLDYVDGGGVTLRGAAPTSAHVLEMTDALAADPLWQGLRVVQLRTGSYAGTEMVHFVIEGQLR